MAVDGRYPGRCAARYDREQMTATRHCTVLRRRLCRRRLSPDYAPLDLRINIM